MALRLAQLFDVSGAFIPTKASIYLKRTGVNAGSYFDLDSNVSIDATNFSSLTQGSNKIVIDDRVAGYTGNGYMRVQAVSGSSWPVVKFPVKTTEPDGFNLYIRGRSSSGQFNADILIDGIRVFQISSVASGTWEWFSSSFTLPDVDSSSLEIRIEEDAALLDKIYISTTASTPTGEGAAFTDSPYITAHLQVYETDGTIPTNPLFIYSYKNSLSDIYIDDWYDFALTGLDSSTVLTFDSSYSLVFTASGGTSKNFVVWELVDNDEYLLLPSAIKV
jgi:hypothetical protein